MEETEAIKRGYLKEDFLLFHIKDNKTEEVQSHFHDFNKIIIFLSGEVTYHIEGKSYKLKPWDILLINSGEIHHPTICKGQEYERIILWINSLYLKNHSSEDSPLLSCFEKAREEKMNLLRLDDSSLKLIKELIYNLEVSWNEASFGKEILSNSIFIQLMVHLNRVFLKVPSSVVIKDVEFDETLQQLIEYINMNLDKNLSIEHLSFKFFLSKYHLMRKFKADTGYTIHNYILQKRLIKARELLIKGVTLDDICTSCGFQDYSNFLRYFKKHYGLPPKQYLRHHKINN